MANIVLASVAIAAIGACQGNRAEPPTTAADTVPADVTEPSAQDCAAVAPMQYDEHGSVHTIVSNQQPIDIQIVPSPSLWCSGGRAAAVVTFTNRGVGVEHLESPLFLVNGGMAKWPITQLASFDLAPGERHSVEVDVTVPAAPPGRYTLIVYGFDDDATITIDGPDPATMPTAVPPTTVFGADSSPCTGHDLTGVAVRRDGAMGNQRTDIVLTNVSGHPCLVFGQPTIEGIRPDGSTEPIPTTDGTYFGPLDSLPDNVVPTAGTVALMLGWGVACLDAGDAPQPWSQLRLLFMDGSYVDVNGGDVDSRCGLGLSNFGTLPT
jgi:hypothetical protein